MVGPAQSGKTAALRQLQDQFGWPLANLNLRLSERLLELTGRQRALRLPRLLDDLVAELAGEVVLLDNLEMLFHPDLQQDPLRLLQGLSRNRTIVASWRGHVHCSSLVYATPDHPEYRRYEAPQTLIVVAEPSEIPRIQLAPGAQESKQ